MENKYFRKSLFEYLRSMPVMSKDKRGMSVGDIYPVMLTITLVAILIAISIYVITSVGNQLVNGSAAQNATVTIVSQIVNFLPWLGIILLIVAAAIVLGILVNDLAGGRSRV